MTDRRVMLAAGLGLAVLAGACHQDKLVTPLVPPYAGGVRFQRYVAFGNSITAGFQGFGLNDSLQRLAYPFLLARAMGGAPFYYPSLANPGCPPPISFIFSSPPTRVGSLPDIFCALRSAPLPPYINNVAFPGADVLEALNSYYAPPQPPASATDVYKLFLLGGKTELQRAREVQPTFVTVWLGNNDVLGAILDTSANAGSPADITPPATFTSRFNAFMDSLASFGTIGGGLLIGVVQVTGAPYVSAGKYYAAAAAAIPTLTVLPNCLASTPIPGGAPGDSAYVYVPFHYGAPIVATAAAGVPDTLDCSDTHVIDVLETLNMIGTVVQYNATIAQAAAARTWPYVDPNPLLRAFAADTNLVRPFPHFPPIPAAPDSISVNAPFGSALSRDGVHPSTATQRVIAQALRDAINAHYSAAIPPIP
jgi:hypothetical protein